MNIMQHKPHLITSIEVRHFYEFLANPVTFRVLKDNDENDVVSMLKELDGPVLVIASDAEQVLYLSELLHDAGIAHFSMSAASDIEENQLTGEKILKSKLGILVCDELSLDYAKKNDFSGILYLTAPDSIEDLLSELLTFLGSRKQTSCMILHTDEDMGLKKQKLSKYALDILDSELDQALAPIRVFVNASVCRKKFLKDYLLPEKKHLICGECDTCVRMYQLTGSEETKVSKKNIPRFILYCIAETREKFGIHTIARVLKGSNAKDIVKYNLNSAFTYGLLKDISKTRLEESIKTLLIDQLIEQTRGTFPTLFLTQKGKKSLNVRQIPTVQLPKRMRLSETENINMYLMDLLRKVRREQAKNYGIPAFKVFSDSVLKQMLIQLPGTENELKSVKGFGKQTWNLCGRQILQVLQDYTK